MINIEEELFKIKMRLNNSSRFCFEISCEQISMDHVEPYCKKSYTLKLKKFLFKNNMFALEILGKR